MLNKMKLAIIDKVYAFLSHCWIHEGLEGGWAWYSLFIKNPLFISLKF